MSLPVNKNQMFPPYLIQAENPSPKLALNFLITSLLIISKMRNLLICCQQILLFTSAHSLSYPASYLIISLLSPHNAGTVNSQFATLPPSPHFPAHLCSCTLPLLALCLMTALPGLLTVSSCVGMMLYPQYYQADQLELSRTCECMTRQLCPVLLLVWLCSN